MSVRIIVVLALAAALIGVPAARGGPVVGAFACSSGGATYEVRAGDGWYVIASRAAVAVDDLLGANDATLDATLVPGDELCLPAGADLLGTCATRTTVLDGDGWGAIAGRAGVSVDAVLAANGASVDRTIHAGEQLCLPAGAQAGGTAAASGTTPSGNDNAAGSTGGQSYTVRSGDSWAGIASRSGMSLRALLSQNGASADTVIHPGDRIALPAGAEVPAASSGWVNLEALPSQSPCWYGRTWQAPRGGGRRHQGVDIFTTSGQYVYAVVDGRLSRPYWDIPGRIPGNAWMLTGNDGSQFFYAHLHGFPPGLSEGTRVVAGQIIGWVGGTGNASAPHLHFEIRPGGGSPVNPNPILDAAGGCNGSRPYTQPGGWIPEKRT